MGLEAEKLELNAAAVGKIVGIVTETSSNFGCFIFFPSFRNFGKSLLCSLLLLCGHCCWSAIAGWMDVSP